MKAVLHKAFSTAMGFLLLASTTSWTVSKHYCMGYLVDVSLFAHAEDCSMEMSKGISCDREEESSCCNDELIVVKGPDDLKHTFNDLNFDQQIFLIAYTDGDTCLFNVQVQQLARNEHYPPPLLVKNIQLLDEVFLI